MEGGVQMGSNLKSIVPHQEYLLQGSVLDSALEVLIHRLRGLCDCAELNPETFSDHEMVFLIKEASKQRRLERESYWIKTLQTLYPLGFNLEPEGTSPQPSQPVLFRARKSLDQPKNPWHLRYLSQVEDKLRHTLSRSCIDVGCSDNVVQFLNEMGFRLDHEYVVRGYMFRKGRLKVTVSKIFRMLQPSNTETIEPLSPSYLVEMSVVAPAGQDQIQEDMKNFADQLKPLVHLDKIDHRRLQAL